MTPDENLAASAGKIDLIVEAMEKLVGGCDPLQLLTSIYWHMNVRLVSLEPTSDHAQEDVAWIWTLTYTINLIAAISPAPRDSPLDPDKAALGARDLVEALMSSLDEYLLQWADAELPRGERPDISHYLEVFLIERDRFSWKCRDFWIPATTPVVPGSRQHSTGCPDLTKYDSPANWMVCPIEPLYSAAERFWLLTRHRC